MASRSGPGPGCSALRSHCRDGSNTARNLPHASLGCGLPGCGCGRRIAGRARNLAQAGLVSHLDSGSHSDMDASTFRASAIAIAPFFGQLAVAGAAGCDMDGLREIGVEAERAMLAATGGINTHRGAIFGLGLLCAAAGAAWSGSAHARWDWRAKILAATVTQRWGHAILRGPIPLHSHGTNALRQFGAGGARAQAAAGFPIALDVGLPALRLGRRLAPGDRRRLASRASSQSWRRWRTPTCFIAEEPQACAMRRKKLQGFSG